MRHFFVDTNVLLDLLTRREPFDQEAGLLLDAAVRGRVRLYVASLSFSHIHYVLRKTNTPAERTDKLLKLARLTQVVAVDETVILRALESQSRDFEDAIQQFAATGIAAITAIVTRDPKGFATGELPALSPAEALRLIG